MKNNNIELTNEEYEYLQGLNLNLTKANEFYYNYDFFIKYIDKTPKEILEMTDSIDKMMLLWFDNIFNDTLENFWGDSYIDLFSGKKSLKDDSCPLNDKESKEYKRYIQYKKIFAASIKTMVENKTKEMQSGFDEMGSISESNNETVKEYLNLMNDLLGDEYNKPEEDYIDIDSKITLYKSVYRDRKKPKISSSMTFLKIMNIVERSNENQKLSVEETQIVDYIAKTINYDSIFKALDPKNKYFIQNYIDVIFVVRALADSTLNNDYHKYYKDILSRKKSINQDVSEIISGGHKNTGMGNAVQEMDDYIRAISVNNTYQEFSQYLFNNTSDFNYIKNANAISDKEIIEKNTKYFEKNANGKTIKYNVKNGNDTYEYKVKLTDEEIENDKKTISENRNYLEDDNASLVKIDELRKIIDKKLKKEALTADELAKLKNFVIEENIDDISDEELTGLKTEVDKVYNQLQNESKTRASKIAALTKANDIIERKKQNIDDNKKVSKFSPLKKWASKITKAACPIVGGMIGCNLAFVLGPVGILAANAIGAFVITQAKAYANILEEKELSEDEIEIESIEKPTNKVCNKVSKFLKKVHLDKLAKFNMFEKLSNTKNEKVNKFFRNKETLRTIANSITIGLIALDLTAFGRMMLKKAALNKKGNTVDAANKGAGNDVGSEVAKPANSGNSTGTTSTANINTPTNSYGDPEVTSLKIGDTVGANGDLTYGYRNSYDALYGKNPVKLNQAIMKDNSVASAVYYPNSQGIMENLNLEEGADIIAELEKRGYDISKAVINTTNEAGKARAFTKIA